MLEVKCFTTIDALNEISLQWEQLLKQSLNNSYSLSWSWISRWLNIFIDDTNQLLCLVVYDDCNLVGIAPLWIDTKSFHLFGKVKTLRFFGSREVCSDHLDLILHHKNSENICTAIWEQLYGPLRRKWDVWEYDYVSADSKVLQFLRKLSDRDNRCLSFKINGYTVCPYIDLPETWKTYLASISANQRRALKISTNHLNEKGGIELRFCKTVQELPAFMETIIKLHRDSWKERGKAGSFATDKFKHFHHKFAEELLKRGNLFLCNLELDNVPFGSFYGFVYNRILYYYLIGVDRSIVPKASIGRVLIGRCIEEAIKRGYTKFDFLRGFESYKYDWTDLEQRELMVTIHNQSYGSLFFILRQFFRSFSRQVGYVAFKDNVKILKRLLGKKPTHASRNM